MEKSKKKIVILGPAHPFRGGLASYNERLAKQFISEGHDVEVYTFTIQYPSFLFPGKTQFSEEPAPKDLKIFRKVNSVSPINWRRVGNELKNKKPDILMFRFWLPFMGPCFGTIAKRVRKNHHTKILALLDNVVPHEKRAGDKQFTSYFIKQVDGFIYMSESVKNDLNLFDTKKPRVFNPHPLFDNFGKKIQREEAITKLGLDNSKKYILFFGLIRDYKGLDLLLQAFAKLQGRKENIRLLIAGEYYSDEEKYRQMIKELQIENEVVVINKFITDSEVNLYFSASEILALPYKHATQSGVTQIAYHFELPMLVTNVGGLPEVVPHNKVGFVSQPEPNQIAEFLQKYFSENLSEIFRTNLKTEKEKFSWEKLTERILELDSLIVK